MADREMKILHFYRTYQPDSCGGIQSFIYQMAYGATQRGHRAEVLFLSRDLPSTPLETANHTAHPVKLNFEFASTGFSFSAFRKFSELAERADIVHYHFPWPFMDVVHFATRVSRPSVVTYHSDVVRQKFGLKLYRPLMNSFLASIDHIVATSPNYFATSDVLQRYKAKTTVIPIGIDHSTYPAPPERTLQHWRSRFGTSFYLFVGVLRYYKGLHILLDAVSGTDIPVVIAGAGPIEQELREHARRLNLSTIHFLGEISEEDKIALTKLCFGVVFPSHLRSEAFGVSLLEGAMFGKPMISSEIGTGTTFVNIDGETGIVVPPSDPDALRRAMMYLRDSPDQAQRMGRNARHRYETLFTGEIMLSKYLALYEGMLSEAKSGDYLNRKRALISSY